MALGRLAGGMHLNAGVIAALGVALVAIVAGLAAAVAPPLRPADWAFVPKQIWPWWPGPPDQTLLVLVSALFALGVAAFLRRPRSGVAQALLAGSAGNAATAALWTTIVPEELAWRSASWLAFLAAGFLSLVLWSSLVHLVFIFPTRDRWLAQPRWLAPLIYLLPPVAMASGAAVMGALNPTALVWVDG
ncbi:MAG TPA: hypothetical protein VMP67_04035 [Candidatus Limnocylindria bacterium]|nr:hypothetical protein [Candidatus Limnocylindria bacterium]